MKTMVNHHCLHPPIILSDTDTDTDGVDDNAGDDSDGGGDDSDNGDDDEDD